MSAWQPRSDRIYVGWGFVAWGLLWLVGPPLLYFCTSKADWAETVGKIADTRNKNCESDGGPCTMDVLMSFSLSTGAVQKTWVMHESVNALWDAVDVPANENGTKILVGASLKLRYDPLNPERVKFLFGTERKLLVFGGFFGGTFFVSGFGVLYGPIRNSFRRRRLAKSGQRFEAEIGRIRQNKHHMRRAGEYSETYYPWIITATWIHPQTGAKYQVESGPIWDDPRDDVYAGGRIVVMVDISRRPYLYAIDSEPLGEAPTVKVLSELCA